MEDSSSSYAISPTGATSVNKRRRLNQRRRSSSSSSSSSSSTGSAASRGPMNPSVVDKDGDDVMTSSSSSSSSSFEESALSLGELLEQRRWEQALARLQVRPEEARCSTNPSPLALSCRYGAPLPLVRELLKAAPEKLRLVLDSRGTPLHEAIVCDAVGPNTIQALLDVDEALPITASGSSSSSSSSNNNSTKRATLLQDVDGFTPLHLLIRRRFQSQILGMAAAAAAADQQQQQPGSNGINNNNNNALMQILEMLVRSCPEVVVIPDLGEYEEPPIVYAIKATIYAPALDIMNTTNNTTDENNDNEMTMTARVERQIYEMVACMLRYCPQAAAQVFSGYRGQYSALHSAVFHGRITNTIELLLQTEAQYNNQQSSTTVAAAAAAAADSGAQEEAPQGQQVPPPKPAAALLGNTQGEIPLHFCAMRGERPRTVALIAHAAPKAVLQRDATGLTPLHWLWVRFVSNLLSLDSSNSAGTAAAATAAADTISLSPVRPSTVDGQNQARYWNYVDFANLELGDFDRDLQLIKRMDPPVDFLRMRRESQLSSLSLSSFT
jgi:ankyrin repeat protein